MAQTQPYPAVSAEPKPIRTVLVIDGNEEHAILSVTALGRKGFRVSSADSGKEGVRVALARPFDAIVVGHKLRDSSGIEVLRVLADKLPRTPMIFVVPSGAEEAALRAMETGAHSYIVKTPRYNELLPAMVGDQIQEAENRRRIEERDKERAQAVTGRRRAEAIQSAFYRISDAAHSARNLTDLYRQIHEIIGGLTPAGNFYIALHNEEEGTLTFPYFVDEQESPPPPQKLGKGLTDYVLRTRRALLASPEVFKDLINRGEVVSIGPPAVDWLGAPLMIQGKVIGVIVVQSYTEGVRFGEEDKAILTFVSEQVAMAIDRKRSEERVAQTTSELQAIFRAVPDVYFRLQSDGTVLGYHAGPSADIFALPPDSMLGMRVQDLFPGPVADRLVAAMQEAFKDRSLTTVELENSTPSGRRDLEARIIPLPDGQLVVVVRDMTEYRLAQRAMAFAEDRYKPLFDGSPEPMWVFDLENLRFLAVNNAAVTHYGYSREEFLSMTIKEIRPEGDVPILLDAVSQLGHGTRKSGVWHHRRKDGSVVDMEILSHPILFDGRRAQLVLAHDVTERRRAEKALRESNDTLSTLFRASPLAMVSFGRDGKVLAWNPAAERIFGWPAEDVIGRPLPTIPSDREEESQRMWQSILSGESLSGFETQRTCRDGTRVDVSIYTAPLRTAEGDVEGIMAIYEDVSLRREMERRLLETERLATMGRLASFVAHELNTPLTSISLLTTTISRRVQDPTVQEKLEKINVERRRAAGIIRELASLARSRQLAPAATDIRGIVEAALEQVEARRTKGVALTRELGDVPVVCIADPLRMQEVLANLLTNALDATEAGRVSVRIEDRADDVAVVVEDTGSGMSSETLARLYQPFFTTKKRGEGIGLGLLISRWVVEALGGRIEVASEPGKGSAFTVVLRKEGPTHEDPSRR